MRGLKKKWTLKRRKDMGTFLDALNGNRPKYLILARRQVGVGVVKKTVRKKSGQVE